MNVLLTGAGRRSYLVHYFQEALAGRGKVVCTNSIPGTPAMEAADVAIIAPLFSDPCYIDTLVEICRAQKIELLCSCHDLDVLVLARHADRFRAIGVTPVLPSAEWAELGLDKYACYQRLQSEGYPLPWQTVSLAYAQEAVKRGEVKLPLVMKARSGFGSMGLRFCKNLDSLERDWQQVCDEVAKAPGNLLSCVPEHASVLIQEYLPGQEYCLDIVNNLNGDYAASFGAMIHGMRAGESDSATTVANDLFGDLGPRLSKTIKHIGIIGVDLLMSADGRLVILEINPRFTGDYPFQQVAGANIPAVLIAWKRGENVRSEWLRPLAGIRGYKDLVPKRAHTSSKGVMLESAFNLN